MNSLPQLNKGQIAKNIKEKRLRLHMTQKELADFAGLSKNGERTIRRWENMETRPSPLEYKLIMSLPEDAPFMNKEDTDYSVVDLFAGIGGLRLGFYQTGRIKVVFFNENDIFATKTYVANFGKTPSGDITQVSTIPCHDILVAAFSHQSGRERAWGEANSILFSQIVSIMKEKKPRAFLFENVKNNIFPNSEKGSHIVETTLQEMGYEIRSMIFNAFDFGLPQNSERVYWVGFYKEKVPNYNAFVDPVPSRNKIRVGDILEKSVNRKYTISDYLWEEQKKNRDKKQGKNIKDMLFNEQSPYTNPISPRYYKDCSEILIEQPGKKPRKLTPRECARLQGFPEEFIIPVSDTQAYKGFGNSACVPVIHAIAEQIINVLDGREVE